MTNSKQIAQPTETQKTIPELSLEQLRQVSGGQTVYLEKATVRPTQTVYLE
ncbi:MAG: hypothetical protein KGL18_11760 [Burkholderiales bacterium]|nr:hypothetical protein [Burkholderiales bacterium]MDE1926417.1 hypothetical protein [Burkholderiales bacterium]MDE2159317.1 hypothetical protein [Burkholderiales bacterium]MDE2503633.1 hypothetical protein [Burkholderiales bacterium]